MITIIFYQLQEKENTVRNEDTLRLNNTVINSQQIVEEIKKEIKKF